MRRLSLIHSSGRSSPAETSALAHSSADGTTVARAATASAAPAVAPSPPFDPAVRALLEQVRIIPPLPRVVRERAIARARAELAAAGAPARVRARTRTREFS